MDVLCSLWIQDAIESIGSPEILRAGMSFQASPPTFTFSIGFPSQKTTSMPKKNERKLYIWMDYAMKGMARRYQARKGRDSRKRGTIIKVFKIVL